MTTEANRAMVLIRADMVESLLNELGLQNLFQALMAKALRFGKVIAL